MKSKQMRPDLIDSTQPVSYKQYFPSSANSPQPNQPLTECVRPDSHWDQIDAQVEESQESPDSAKYLLYFLEFSVYSNTS